MQALPKRSAQLAAGERLKVDRIACPWLIVRFIDEEPEFLFVPSIQANPRCCAA
ncbi:MAG TPA: chromate resistance protein ChrB domain-containing protein [Novimethylophilus sp.]|uniref:chromate resistance protein ChrB domain-containing protein n=1 Tax=Novimethylophilus sp. TaxID=2137426 RepID=UPI002F427CC5